MENGGGTLAVAPVSSQSENMQIPTTELNPSLQVLATSQSANTIQELGGIAQEGDGQDLEAILNQGTSGEKRA